MFGSEILDVAAGLAFLFAALSLFATSVREAVEAFLQTRAIHLERGVRALLGDNDGTGAASDVFNHPMIRSLYTGVYKANELTLRTFKAKDSTQRVKFKSNLPAYIPARNFALALMDLAGRGKPDEAGAESPLTVSAIRERLDVLIAEPHLRRTISIALDDAGDDLERARTNIETWFNSGMERVSGWYKKETQWILFAVGLFTAVSLNVDTIRVAHALYTNEALRTAVVAQAEGVAKAETADDAARLAAIGCEASAAAKDKMSCTEQRIMKLGLPIGWDAGFVFSFSTIPGWLLTALAISLGAPFWFDMLNKIMTIRSTIKPGEKAATNAPSILPPPDPAALASSSQMASQKLSSLLSTTQPPPNPHGEPNRIEADDFPDVHARLAGKLDPQEDMQ